MYGIWNISNFKNQVLLASLRNRVEKAIDLNAKTLLENIYLTNRVDASESEKKNFYDKYIKKMYLKVSDDGNIKIEIPE